MSLAFFRVSDGYPGPILTKHELWNKLRYLCVYDDAGYGFSSGCATTDDSISTFSTSEAGLLKWIEAHQGCLSETTSPNHVDALFYIALIGNLKAIQYLFENRGCLNIRFTKTDIDGRNFLHYLALSGNREAFEFAVNHHEELNIELNVSDNTGKNILHYAALSGNPRIIDYVFENHDRFGLSLDTKGLDGKNMLHCAIWSGNPHAVKRVIENCKKFDVALEDSADCHWTFLDCAIWSGKVDMLEYVLATYYENRFDKAPQPRNIIGINWWHFAAWSGHIEMIEYMYKRLDELGIASNIMGRDRDVRDFAAYSGNIAAVCYILDLNIKYESINRRICNWPASLEMMGMTLPKDRPCCIM